MNLKKKIFSIQSNKDFEKIVFKIFNFHMKNNDIYNYYIKLMKINIEKIENIYDIPFLPISLFKTHLITINKSIIKKCKSQYDTIFISSGTTGKKSKHYINDINIYTNSIKNGFELFYGPINNFLFLGIFPNYKKNSSLIYMMNFFINKTSKNGSKFIFYPYDQLDIESIIENSYNKTILVFGLSYSLLDFIKKFKYNIFSKKNIIVMETGGMKGKREEITRDELHFILKNFFSVNHIHSEYGMTEMLSQAYSKNMGDFKCPPWMNVYIRETEDPFYHIKNNNVIGGINIIDLSNYLSCPFISTDDLGLKVDINKFKVLGRIDFSDLRGCNSMVF
ncbi:long-chain-fatty-acid--protein ligase [Blattabacterium cuenoti]|uniref:LuxE family acyl-protein synthetase/acyl-CoA reductase n=1 Tax=Blattabacterium cuenoti TaxID=1653831 RepID=UPI00163C3E69|nr:LuxE family acyl-protein synthetase/acyl-CoA reductase [Blattabacterium cuenoti]